MGDFEEIIKKYEELQGVFQKSANITGAIIALMKKAKELEDEGKDDSEESKKILKRIEDKTDEFAVQMIKIAKLAQ